MKPKYILSLITAVIFVVSACDKVNNPLPDAYSINGKITFVDSNFVAAGGEYRIISVEAGWPNLNNPSSVAAFTPTRSNGAWQMDYNYTLTDVESGYHKVAVAYFDSSSNKYSVLGVYGCDTLRDPVCYNNPPEQAFIYTTSGVLNIDFKSWSDTTNKLYTY